MMLHTRLKATRKARGLDQKDAAAAIGVTQSWMSKLERGQATPNVEMLRKLAKLYGVTETYLLGEHPERIPLESERWSAKERILSDAAAQPVGQIAIQKHPGFARLRARDLAGCGALPQRLGVQPQEFSGLMQIQCFHNVSSICAAPARAESDARHGRHRSSSGPPSCSACLYTCAKFPLWSRLLLSIPQCSQIHCLIGSPQTYGLFCSSISFTHKKARSGRAWPAVFGVPVLGVSFDA